MISLSCSSTRQKRSEVGCDYLRQGFRHTAGDPPASAHTSFVPLQGPGQGTPAIVRLRDLQEKKVAKARGERR
jgi:hypothetical protein